MKKNKVISFGFLIVAFVFFSNPNINLFDILPDAISCILIAFAIGKLSDVCDRLDGAKSAFYTLFWITLSKGPALIVLRSVVDRNINEATMWLLFSFCYAVLEIVFGIRAWNALFDGLAYLGSRSDGGEFIFIPTEKEIKKSGGNFRFDMLKRFTAVFVIVKSAMFTLPELLYIYPQDYINPSAFNVLDYRPHLIVLCAFVAFVFGIAWVVCMCAYAIYLSRHHAFWDSMYMQYSEKVATKSGLFLMRAVKLFALILAFAFAFSVDVYIDEYNYIPDFLSAVMFFAAACVIGKYTGGARALKITSAAYFATSALTFVTMLMFKTDCFSPIGYSYMNVYSNANAANLYMMYAISNAANQIAFLATVFSVSALLMRVVHEHTGINTLTGVSSSSKTLEKVYASRINRMRVISVLTAITSVLYFYLIVYFERVETRVGFSYMPTYSLIWMVDLIVAAIFAIHASNVASDISGEVEYKYKYE